MSVIAMKVIDATQHPNADVLRVYKLAAPSCGEIQIVANLENEYQVGDVVAVALVDSILADGTRIKPSKLRGIYSYGMALGKTDVELGCNLSDIYGVKDDRPQLKKTFIKNKPQILKWTSIESLHHIRQEISSNTNVTYRAKIKLDGTNGGVRIFPDGRIFAQSRTQIITPESDNMGFAAWVDRHQDYFRSLKSDRAIAIYGEWCGRGIQKRTAISQLNRQIFAIFAIQYGGCDGMVAQLEVRPDAIAKILPKKTQEIEDDLFILPFYGEAIALDFGDTEQLKAAAAKLNEMVKTVEAIDPWVRDTFGIEGMGEGLVMYPDTDGLVMREGYTELMFKAKGEKHQVVKTKQPVQIEPEVAASIDEFVELFVTQSRLEQAVTEACQGQYDLPKTGQFLKWLMRDIQKESKAELTAANLTWKQVNKSVATAAKNWYKIKAWNNQSG
jgi:tRNA-binding EMAP/Myf-like protein